MKKVLRQFRYYGADRIDENYPSDITRDNLESGLIFTKGLTAANIVSLGIQTIPGIRFRLGDEPIDSIIIGSTGTYELTLADNYEIGQLRFLRESVDLINDNPNAYLIIDIIYNVEE